MTNPWWRPFQQAIVFVCAGAFVILLAWMLITVLQIANRIEALSSGTDDTVTEIRESQKGSRSLLNLIQDCTQPNGECYQQSEARDAEQAGAFNAALIATRYCADRVLPADYTLRELTACVGKILDGKGHR